MKQLSWQRSRHSHRSVDGVGLHSSAVLQNIFACPEKLERSKKLAVMKVSHRKVLVLAGQHRKAEPEL
jgi:hypothetical protein